MTAVVTDAHYRMSVSLIRDLVDAGVTVVVCESARFPNPPGFACRGISRAVTLPEEDESGALYTLCAQIAAQDDKKPALLPVGAKTLAALAASRERFDAVCGLCIPSAQQLALLNDKSAVHRLAQQVGVRVPAVYAPAEGQPLPRFAASVPLPCVIKPLCGEKFGLSAKERYVIARTPAEVETAYARFCAVTGTAPLVQQYLTGEGMGCSVLAENGKILCAVSHRRIREYPVSGGPSSCCTTIKNTVLLPLVEPLVQAVGLTGLAMFEFKTDAEGTPHLLECNPRIWGTYPLTRAAGTNFSVCWCCRSAGVPMPEYQRPKTVKMVYYPSDLAAMLGYLRHGKVSRVLGGIGDLLSRKAKNGLYERNDPVPARRYRQNLRKRREQP